MTNPARTTEIDLQEAITRNHTARALVAEFTATLPELGTSLRRIDAALSDAHTLILRISHLHAELGTTRLARADLIAAARAALTAYDESEPDPLWYLRDELTHQDPTSWGRA